MGARLGGSACSWLCCHMTHAGMAVWRQGVDLAINLSSTQPRLCATRLKTAHAILSNHATQQLTARVAGAHKPDTQ